MSPSITAAMDFLNRVLGLHVQPGELTFFQMGLRSFVVFVFGIFIVRLGDRRLLGRNADFDMLLLVILGSVLSRAINGQASFFPTLGGSGLLIFFHHLLGVLACHSDRFSELVKGRSRLVIKDGRADQAELRRCRMSTEDLEENIRLNGNVSEPRDVQEARLERNGTISVVRKDDRD